MTKSTPDPNGDQNRDPMDGCGDGEGNDSNHTNDVNMAEDVDEELLIEQNIEELSQLDNKLDQISNFLDHIEEQNESLRQQINSFLNDIKEDNNSKKVDNN